MDVMEAYAWQLLEEISNNDTQWLPQAVMATEYIEVTCLNSTRPFPVAAPYTVGNLTDALKFVNWAFMALCPDLTTTQIMQYQSMGVGGKTLFWKLIGDSVNITFSIKPKFR